MEEYYRRLYIYFEIDNNYFKSGNITYAWIELYTVGSSSLEWLHFRKVNNTVWFGARELEHPCSCNILALITRLEISQLRRWILKAARGNRAITIAGIWMQLCPTVWAGAFQNYRVFKGLSQLSQVARSSCFISLHCLTFCRFLPLSFQQHLAKPCRWRLFMNLMTSGCWCCAVISHLSRQSSSPQDVGLQQTGEFFTGKFKSTSFLPRLETYVCLRNCLSQGISTHYLCVHFCVTLLRLEEQMIVTLAFCSEQAEVFLLQFYYLFIRIVKDPRSLSNKSNRFKGSSIITLSDKLQLTLWLRSLEVSQADSAR